MTLSYAAYDVDSSHEVAILLNGELVGYADTTPNDDWGEVTETRLPDALVLDEGLNQLTFDNTANPPKTYGWGVRGVEVEGVCPSCIPLPATGAYGRILGGDQSHVDRVDFSFQGAAGDIVVFYRVWDVDTDDEVEILVNGEPIAHAETTPDSGWSDTRVIVLPDASVLDAGTNVLTFDNTVNPPKTYWWGVGDVTVDEGCSYCIALPDSSAYGRIRNGDQTHVEEVIYSFTGAPGDVTVSYAVWDVDFDDEVEILVNGTHVAFADTTADNAWSAPRTVVLTDADVLDAGTNVLTFSNAYNPPKTYWWGVGDVSIDEGCTDCIPLPASGEYGRIRSGDQTHVNEVNYSFDGVAGDVTIAYRVWDVDLGDEVEILINGNPVLFTGPTDNESWSEVRQVVLPDADVLDTGTNVLTFSNAYNPPRTWLWGVGSVSVEP